MLDEIVSDILTQYVALRRNYATSSSHQPTVSGRDDWTYLIVEASDFFAQSLIFFNGLLLPNACELQSTSRFASLLRCSHPVDAPSAWRLPSAYPLQVFFVSDCVAAMLMTGGLPCWFLCWAGWILLAQWPTVAWLKAKFPPHCKECPCYRCDGMHQAPNRSSGTFAWRVKIKLSYICGGIAQHCVFGQFVAKQNRQIGASSIFVGGEGSESDCSVCKVGWCLIGMDITISGVWDAMCWCDLSTTIWSPQ